jgi:hypothetical protein
MIQHVDGAGALRLGNRALNLCWGSSDYNVIPDGQGGVFVLTTCFSPNTFKHLQHMSRTDSLLLGDRPVAGKIFGSPGNWSVFCSDRVGGFFSATTTVGIEGAVLKYLHLDGSVVTSFPEDGLELCATLMDNGHHFFIENTATNEAMVVWEDIRRVPPLSGGIYIAKINDHSIVPVELFAGSRQRVLTLRHPYPNPASTSSLLNYSLSKPSSMHVTLTDIDGRDLGLLYEGEQPEGEFFVPIDTSPLAPGSYFIVAKAGEETRTTRLIVTGK